MLDGVRVGTEVWSPRKNSFFHPAFLTGSQVLVRMGRPVSKILVKTEVIIICVIGLKVCSFVMGMTACGKCL